MPIDERRNPHPEERGLREEGSADPNTSGSSELDSSEQSQMIENAARLDEIESLLHELSSEFRPTIEAAQRHEAASDEDEPGALPGGDTNETVRLPAADGFELNKPVDYDPDPERYDHRRASDTDGYSITAQSMAKRLAPAQKPAQNMKHSAPFDEMTSHHSESAPSPEAEFEPRLEPSRQPKRRMRLRPARRVSGSRPEPRVPLPSAQAGSYNTTWSPGHAAPGRSGRRLAIGTAMTVLIIGGTAATFAMVAPMRSLLPERLAVILEGTSAVPTTLSPDQNAGTETAAEIALVEPTRETGSFTVASVPSDGPVSAQQASAAMVEPSQPRVSATATAQPPARIAEQEFKPAKASPTEAEQIVSGQKVKKSTARLTQDTVVQATPDTPDNSVAQNRLANVLGSAEKAADPIVTGSVMPDKPVKPAVQNNQTEFRIRTVKTTAVTGQAARIADPGDQKTTVSEASAYAPSSPDVSENVPFPGTEVAQQQTQVARLTPESENTPKQSAGPNPLKGIDGLLARGHDLLKSGHIASARLLFRRVASMGDERGAKGMGMTFDPDVYATLPVAGVTPDRERAEYWYRKASELARHKRIPDAGETDARSVDKN